MSEPVQQGGGESLGAKDSGAFLEGRVRGQHEVMTFIEPAGILVTQATAANAMTLRNGKSVHKQSGAF